MRAVPQLDYLRRIERGEILVRAQRHPTRGRVWSADGGLLRLRLHEEAGYVQRLFTGRWAGIPDSMGGGTPARLTDKGRAFLEANTVTAG